MAPDKLDPFESSELTREKLLGYIARGNDEALEALRAYEPATISDVVDAMLIEQRKSGQDFNVRNQVPEGEENALILDWAAMLRHNSNAVSRVDPQKANTSLQNTCISYVKFLTTIFPRDARLLERLVATMREAEIDPSRFEDGDQLLAAEEISRAVIKSILKGAKDVDLEWGEQLQEAYEGGKDDEAEQS